MEWEVVPESATVTLIVCTPAGVPGMVTGAFGEVELQPERESSPAANRNVSRLARIRRLLSPRMRRGEQARNTRAAGGYVVGAGSSGENRERCHPVGKHTAVEAEAAFAECSGARGEGHGSGGVVRRRDGCGVGDQLALVNAGGRG